MSFADSIFKGGEDLLVRAEGDPALLRHVTETYDPTTRAVIETTSDEQVSMFIRDYDIEEMAGGSAILVGDQSVRIVGAKTPPKVGDRILLGLDPVNSPSLTLYKVDPVYSGVTPIAYVCQARS